MSYERMIYDSVKEHMSNIGYLSPQSLTQSDVNTFLLGEISKLMTRIDTLEKQIEDKNE